MGGKWCRFAAGLLRATSCTSWAVLLFVLSGGCDRDNVAKDGGASAAPPARFTLVVSADTAGWITPCGCASNQSGGMLRRGTYLEQVRQRGGGSSGDVLYADAGGAAGGTSDYHKVKFEAILAGEAKLRLAAHNIGKSEAALGTAYLREVAARTKAPLVSANVRDAAGQPLAPLAQVAAAGNRRVAFVGVMSPRFATRELQVAEPRQAVIDAVAP